jgi:hypothetical protein
MGDALRRAEVAAGRPDIIDNTRSLGVCSAHLQEFVTGPTCIAPHIFPYFDAEERYREHIESNFTH